MKMIERCSLLLLLGLLWLDLTHSYVTHLKLSPWEGSRCRKVGLNARRKNPEQAALNRQRRRVQKGLSRKGEQVEANDEDEEVVFPPDEEYLEEAKKNGLIEDMFPLPRPNPNNVPSTHTNFRFTNDDADSLITLEDLARGYRRPALMPSSPEEAESEEGFPIFDFQKEYLLLGMFDSSNREVLRKRGDLFDYHLQWGRRTQLVNEIRIRSPFISDKSITEVVDLTSLGAEEASKKDLLSAKILVEEEFTLLDDDRLKPVGQALLVRANATADVRDYLQIEPFQQQGLLRPRGWQVFELGGKEAVLESFNASLRSDVFRPFYVLGRVTWQWSTILRTLQQLPPTTDPSSFAPLISKIEGENRFFLQQLHFLAAPLRGDKRRRHLLHLFSQSHPTTSETVEEIATGLVRNSEEWLGKLRALIDNPKNAKGKGVGMGEGKGLYDVVKGVLVERWKLHTIVTTFLREYGKYQYQHGDVDYGEGMGEGMTLLMNQAENEVLNDHDDGSDEGGRGGQRFLHNRLEDLYREENSDQSGQSGHRGGGKGGELLYRGRSRICSYSTVMQAEDDQAEESDTELKDIADVRRELLSFVRQHGLSEEAVRMVGVQLVINGASNSDVLRFLQSDVLIPHFQPLTATTTPTTPSNSNGQAASQEEGGGVERGQQRRKKDLKQSQGKGGEKGSGVSGDSNDAMALNRVNGLPREFCRRLVSSVCDVSDASTTMKERIADKDLVSLLLPTPSLVIAPVNVQDVDGLNRLGNVFLTSDSVSQSSSEEVENIEKYMLTNIREFHNMDSQDLLKVEHANLPNNPLNRQENYRVLNLLKRSGVGALFREFNENAIEKIESSSSLIEEAIRKAAERRKIREEAAEMKEEGRREDEETDEDWDRRSSGRGRRGRKRSSSLSEEEAEGESSMEDEDDEDPLLARAARAERRRDEGRPVREDYDSGDNGGGDW